MAEVGKEKGFPKDRNNKTSWKRLKVYHVFANQIFAAFSSHEVLL